MKDVSRETAALLDFYEKLLRRWNSKINLVGDKTLMEFHTRHVQDSLQLLDCVDSMPSSWVDMGSGGGLPGIVVAAALGDATSVTLIESDGRKCAFLRTAVRGMKLRNVTVLNARIEAVPVQSADIVSARALAPLPALLQFVSRHIAPDGVALLPKGRGWREEITAAQLDWQFHYEALPSKTDPEAVVLKISKVSRA